MVDKYSCFSELAEHETRERDYEIFARRQVESQVAIIAPHGGKIEPRTSEIAESIAGAEFSFYSFQGCKPRGNRDLHITSHKFDEPECLGLVAEHDWVLAIHGCKKPGEKVFLGGLDEPLVRDLASALNNEGIRVETDNRLYRARRPYNICNRGARGAGAQIELSPLFRRGTQVQLFTEVVRDVLARL